MLNSLTNTHNDLSLLMLEVISLCKQGRYHEAGALFLERTSGWGIYYKTTEQKISKQENTFVIERYNHPRVQALLNKRDYYIISKRDSVVSNTEEYVLFIKIVNEMDQEIHSVMRGIYQNGSWSKAMRKKAKLKWMFNEIRCISKSQDFKNYNSKN